MLDEKVLGKKYCQELQEVIDIRVDRRKIYGDSFLDESPESILAIIDGKRNRFNAINKNDDLSQEQLNKSLDELRDIVNYYVFYICQYKYHHSK